MGAIEITLKNGAVIREVFATAEDKAEVRERLQEDGTREQFVSAVVEYDGQGDAHQHVLNTFDEVIQELGKFGG